MLYLGEWVINGFKTSDEKDYDHDVPKITQEVKKEAKQRWMDKYITKYKDEWFRTGEFERPTLEYLEEFKDFSLFDELAERLAYRDFAKRFGREPDFKNNDQDYRDFGVIREMWDDEFDEFWLTRLNV